MVGLRKLVISTCKKSMAESHLMYFLTFYTYNYICDARFAAINRSANYHILCIVIHVQIMYIYVTVAVTNLDAIYGL